MRARARGPEGPTGPLPLTVVPPPCTGRRLQRPQERADASEGVLRGMGAWGRGGADVTGVGTDSPGTPGPAAGKAGVKRGYDGGMEKKDFMQHLATKGQTPLHPEELAAFGELLERAMTALDEDGEKRLEKARQVAERRLERGNLPEAPVDFGAVKRLLLEYAKLERSQAACVKALKVDRMMLMTAYDLWPESKVVRDYVKEMRERALDMENEETRDVARTALRRLMTEDGAKLNAQTVMFAAERLDRRSFGPVRREGAEERVPVVYNLPGLTMNLVMAPGEAKALKAEPGDVVDVTPGP